VGIAAAVLAGPVTSLAVWWLTKGEDGAQTQRGILVASVGILVTLLSFIYWLVLAGVLRLLTHDGRKANAA
jgi:ABC-type enterobactin transport system permease subunit